MISPCKKNTGVFLFLSSIVWVYPERGIYLLHNQLIIKTNTVMKTITTASVYGLDSSKNFESKISRLINDQLASSSLAPALDIYIRDAGIKRGSGYGQYREFVCLTIDNDDIDVSVHSTCAPDFDFFNNNEYINQTYSNRLKSLVYRVIESRLDAIELEIIKEREYQKAINS